MRKVVQVSINLVSLFRSLCKHKGNDYSDSIERFKWQECNECVLRNIHRIEPQGYNRDLCWWIWHEGILGKPPKSENEQNDSVQQQQVASGEAANNHA